MCRELIAVINSDDSINLEWNEIKEDITKDKDVFKQLSSLKILKIRGHYTSLN